jgi:hypothetical protein
VQLGILPLAVVVEIVAADRLGVLALSAEPPAVMKAARSLPRSAVRWNGIAHGELRERQ